MAKRKLILKNSEKETRTSYYTINLTDSRLDCIANHPQHVKSATIKGDSYLSAYGTKIDKLTLLNESKVHFLCDAKIKSLEAYDHSNIWPSCATIKNISMFMNSSGVIDQDNCDDRQVKVDVIHMYGNAKLEISDCNIDCIYLHDYARLRLEPGANVKRVVMTGGSNIYSLRGGHIDELVMLGHSDGHVENMTFGHVKIGKDASLETFECSFDTAVSSGCLILENMRKTIKSIKVYGGYTSLCADESRFDDDYEMANVDLVSAVAGKLYLECHIANITKLSVSEKCEFDGGACLDEYVCFLKWHGKQMDPLHWVISADD